jgi:hypothetical protein
VITHVDPATARRMTEVGGCGRATPVFAASRNPIESSHLDPVSTDFQEWERRDGL